MGQSWRAGVAFVRDERSVPRITVYLLIGALFVAVTIAYGTLEIYGGSQVGGWRAIAIGQAYIVMRLAIRLIVRRLRAAAVCNACHAVIAEYGTSIVWIGTIQSLALRIDDHHRDELRQRRSARDQEHRPLTPLQSVAPPATIPPAPLVQTAMYTGE